MTAMRLIALIFTPVILLGCSIGPTVIRENASRYNSAVRSVMNEELLLNLVRLRYSESTQFMSVQTIASNTNLSIGIDGGVAIDSTTTTSANGQLGYVDNPTITFVPRQGEELATQLLAPISIENLAYLCHAGWSAEWVFKSLVANANGVRGPIVSANNPLRTGSTSWHRLINLISQLERKGELQIGFVRIYDPYLSVPLEGSALKPTDFLAAVQYKSRWRSSDEGKTYQLTSQDDEPVLWLTPEGKESEAGIEFMKILHLDPTQPYYPFSRGRTPVSPKGLTDTLYLRTASFVNTLRMISAAVMPPEADVQTSLCWAVIPGSSDAEMILNLRRNFEVLSSKSPPKNTAVSVKYKGSWFYVDDRNLNAKLVFGFLVELFNLQITGTSSTPAPILTIPIG